MNKRYLELEVERSLNDFLNLQPAEFIVNYSIKQFRRLISLIPLTYQFVQMEVSLMFDFEQLEAYEFCAILRDRIKEYLD